MLPGPPWTHSHGFPDPPPRHALWASDPARALVTLPRELIEVLHRRDEDDGAATFVLGYGDWVRLLYVDAGFVPVHLTAEIARVKDDSEFMENLRTLTERDREILDRLAE